jgi:hypothetical protein
VHLGCGECKKLVNGKRASVMDQMLKVYRDGQDLFARPAKDTWGLALCRRRLARTLVRPKVRGASLERECEKDGGGGDDGDDGDVSGSFEDSEDDENKENIPPKTGEMEASTRYGQVQHLATPPMMYDEYVWERPDGSLMCLTPGYELIGTEWDCSFIDDGS